MGKADPRENNKVRAAYAAIVPFVIAEVVILVVEYAGYEVHPGFFGILLVVNIVLAALVFVLVNSVGR